MKTHLILLSLKSRTLLNVKKKVSAGVSLKASSFSAVMFVPSPAIVLWPLQEGLSVG